MEGTVLTVWEVVGVPDETFNRLNSFREKFTLSVFTCVMMSTPTNLVP